MISARLLPRPDQIAQLLERCRRHEAGLDKISRQADRAAGWAPRRKCAWSAPSQRASMAVEKYRTSGLPSWLSGAAAGQRRNALLRRSGDARCPPHRAAARTGLSRAILTLVFCNFAVAFATCLKCNSLTRTLERSRANFRSVTILPKTKASRNGCGVVKRRSACRARALAQHICSRRGDIKLTS